MTDNTSSDAGATPGTGSPVTGNASSGATPPAATLTHEDALKRIAELEHAHKNAREQADRQAKALSKYEADELARQQAAMGDLEKATQRADQAEKQIKQYQEQLVHAEIKLAAQGKGIINPDLIADSIFKALEFEDGKPTNLDKALDELIKANPYLVKQETGQLAAQTGSQKHAPALPVMSEGRSNLAQPSTLPPGKVTTWLDYYNTGKK